MFRTSSRPFINQNASTLSFIMRELSRLVRAPALKVFGFCHAQKAVKVSGTRISSNLNLRLMFFPNISKSTNNNYKYNHVYISKRDYFKTSPAAFSLPKMPSPPEISDLTVEVSGALKVRCLICQS